MNLALSEIKIYTVKFCLYCLRAKDLLTSKGVSFEEIDVSHDNEKRVKMAELAGSYSVPQIFVDDRYIGDCDGVFMLDSEGVLDLKLKGLE